MMHKGEIIKQVVKEKKISIVELSRRMKISRKTVYNIFSRIDVDSDTILAIGAILPYDFSEKFPKLKKHITTVEDSNQAAYLHPKIIELNDEVELWRAKYIALLEEYSKLLRK